MRFGSIFQKSLPTQSTQHSKSVNGTINNYIIVILPLLSFEYYILIKWDKIECRLEFIVINSHIDIYFCVCVSMYFVIFASLFCSFHLFCFQSIFTASWDVNVFRLTDENTHSKKKIANLLSLNNGTSCNFVLKVSHKNCRLLSNSDPAKKIHHVVHEFIVSYK